MSDQLSVPPLKLRKLWLFTGYGLIVLVIYLSLRHNPPQLPLFPWVDKLQHFSAYGVLMLWFSMLYHGLKQRAGIAAGFVAMGVLMEILQGIEGFRVFEYADMLANTLGVLIGWGLGLTALKRFLLWLERI